MKKKEQDSGNCNEIMSNVLHCTNFTKEFLSSSISVPNIGAGNNNSEDDDKRWNENQSEINTVTWHPDNNRLIGICINGVQTSFDYLTADYLMYP